jgi:ABC-2 type transport system ATP-binding protein
MSRWGLDSAVVRLGEAVALDGVSLDVGSGEVAVVVGGDGAGKSTLARTLAGLVSPSSGGVRRPDRRRVGYQPSGSGVWPDLTVTENLSFMAAVHHVEGSDARARVDGLLAATELSEAADRLGAQLSGGMRRKLGVAMALFAAPELLVLDEPTTGVDPVSRFDLWRLVTETAAAGTAVVMTTTYLDEAERAQTILVLDGGRTLAAGTPAAVVGAMPGAVYEAGHAVAGFRHWRRGSSWRLWTDGAAPPGATAIVPDLGDVLIATALAAEGRTPS